MSIIVTNFCITLLFKKWRISCNCKYCFPSSVTCHSVFNFRVLSHLFASYSVCTLIIDSIYVAAEEAFDKLVRVSCFLWSTSCKNRGWCKLPDIRFRTVRSRMIRFRPKTFWWKVFGGPRSEVHPNRRCKNLRLNKQTSFEIFFVNWCRIIQWCSAFLLIGQFLKGAGNFKRQNLMKG